MSDDALSQTANALFQVDDSDYSGSQPLYKMVLKGVDLAELVDLAVLVDRGELADPENPEELLGLVE